MVNTEEDRVCAALEVTEDRRTLKSLWPDPTSGCKQRNVARNVQCGDWTCGRWLPTMSVGHEFWKETLLLSFASELHKLLNSLTEEGWEWVTTGEMN